MTSFTFESLEPRRLFTAEGIRPIAPPTPTAAQIAAATHADKAASTAQFHIDEQQFASDSANDNAAVSAARHAILVGSARKNKLNADQAAATALLAADQAALTATATANLSPVIPAHLTPNAHGTSTYTYQTSSTQFTALALPPATKLEADRASTSATTAADKAAISALLNASPAYTAALAKQQNDLNTDNAIIDAGTSLRPGNFPSFAAIMLSPIPPFAYNPFGIIALPFQNYPTQLQAISAKLSNDQDINAATETADNAAISTAKRKVIKSTPAQLQLKADQAAGAAAHAADGTAFDNLATSAEATILADYAQIAADHGNSTSLAMARSQLTSDQSRFGAELASLALKVFNGDDASAIKIAADQSTIQSMLAANAAYTSAQAKFASDAMNNAPSIDADQALLIAAKAS